MTDELESFVTRETAAAAAKMLFQDGATVQLGDMDCLHIIPAKVFS